MALALQIGGTMRIGETDIALAPTYALLNAIARDGSVQGAAKRLGVSYRSAWGRIAALEAILARPVAVKTKGHGSVLTAFGTSLHATLEQTFERLGPLVDAERPELERRLAGVLGSGPVVLRLAVSNDTLLLDAIAEMPGIVVTIAGSTDALGKLAAGLADVAGFHFGSTDPAPDSPFAEVFRDPGLAIRPVLRREQGFMLAPGNPLGIRSVGDLVARGARYVNRQTGAGTRIWFDRLCAESGIRTSAVRGYATEEFTHQAVAALIAAGAADAGLGAQAVAERFGLDFLPVGEETYYLAMRLSADLGRIEPIIAAIRSRAETASGYAPVS